ncbi:MAG TPA: reverse transcriptase/maturase family protein [Anaerolineales bacterium]|nr:reverse transcriptase/maturase family protein [Anaerolineales bacterium]
MKTYKHLYPQIASFENLYLAFKAARRGKRSRPDVAGFEYNLEENLLALQSQLQNETYTPGRYHNFPVYDPKPRLISAAPFRDRVVHHALCRVIEPLFDRRFIFDTYACRVGKGTHAAIDRAQGFSKKYPYVLKCDIEHFFPHMDHQVLYDQFRRVLADTRTLRLCKLILDSGSGIHAGVPPAYLPGDDPSAGSGQRLFSILRPRGLPIGNLTSQFWANVYLNPLDHFIKRELKCPGYVRYVDDFLLFAENKNSLHEWRLEVMRFLASLRLTLHEAEAQIFPTQTGIPFLGWRVYPGHLRLKRRNAVAFQRRYVKLRQGLAQGKITFERLNAGVQGWIAHVSHGQTWGLRRSLLTRVTISSHRHCEGKA